MYDSSYYNNQYKSYKSAVSGYEKNIAALTKIKNNLSGNFYDEQNHVNSKLGSLKDDLKKSVRHDAGFTSNAGLCDTYKEKSVNSDGNLNSVLIALENEINSLNQKKNTATQNMNESYNQYRTKKEEEQQEFLNTLANIF